MNADGSRQWEEQQLIDKLRKIEALFARPGTEGERAAAGSAAERIRARLHGVRQEERPREHQFSIHDPWARTLFLALVRRYGLHPYRHKGQPAPRSWCKPARASSRTRCGRNSVHYSRRCRAI